MTAAHEVDDILRELALKPGQFFLGGSAPLALRNVRPLGDLDVGVTTAYWFKLLRSGDWGIWTTDTDDPLCRCDPPYLFRDVTVGDRVVEVNVFFAWRRRVRDGREYGATDYNELFRDGLEDVNGWPCVKLPILLRLKSEHQRVKDLPDVAEIARIIGEEAAA